MCDAVLLLLQHPTIRINEKTSQGSSPLMVAVKYGKKTIVDILIKDCRVDLGTIDNQGRTLFDVIGVANENVKDDVRKEIKELLKAEINKRSLRKKKKGIHNGDYHMNYQFVSFKNDFRTRSRPIDSQAG